MGKNKNIDFITDMQDRANHNINPYYWFNRVTPFTMAQWRTNKYFAPLFFIMYTSIGVLWLYTLNEAALVDNKSFWAFLFDFDDALTTARFVGVLLFSVYWVIAGIGTVQNIIQRIYAPTPISQPERKKEKKKKYPKRPKNYK
jgi:hypothetical protein